MEQNITVTELENELVEALKEKETEAYALLNVSAKDNPEDIVKTIRKYVDKVLSENHSEEDLREYALRLGSLWGEMVVRHYKWAWKYLDFGEDGGGIYIVSPNAYYCCPPLYFLTKILLGNNSGLDGRNDNTVMLLFNMIEGIENNKPNTNYQVIS